MDINEKSKFNPEQEVFCIESYIEEPICEICEGNKNVSVTNSKGTYIIECSNCNGTGRRGENRFYLWKIKKSDFPWKIDSITLRLCRYDKYKPDFSYGISCINSYGGGTSTTIEEKDCFTTLEKALAEIEKRNANPESYDD